MENSRLISFLPFEFRQMGKMDIVALFREGLSEVFATVDERGIVAIEIRITVTGYECNVLNYHVANAHPVMQNAMYLFSSPLIGPITVKMQNVGCW